MSHKSSHKPFIRRWVHRAHWSIDEEGQWHIIDDGNELIQEWRNGPSPQKTHRKHYYWRCRYGLIQHAMQQAGSTDVAMTELDALGVCRSSAYFKRTRLTAAWSVDVADWDGRCAPKANSWKDAKVRHQWQWHQGK